MIGGRPNDEARRAIEWPGLLADAIAVARELGYPVRFPDPETEHGRRLLEAFGVELEPVEIPARKP